MASDGLERDKSERQLNERSEPTRVERQVRDGGRGLEGEMEGKEEREPPRGKKQEAGEVVEIT